MARSRSSTSSRARASGIACSGLEDERMNVTSPESPASATIPPSCTATAWTRWTASTTSPRHTDTLSGSMRRSLKSIYPSGGLWRHGDFMKLWAGQSISEFGSQVSQLAIPLVAVVVLKATAFEVASLATVEFLPFILFTLPAGVWVDRLSRRLALIVGDAGRALLLPSIPIAYVFDALTLGQL